MKIKLLKLRSSKILCSAVLVFTGFSAFAQAPGGVSNNLTLWLKADNLATIIGSPVQSWSSSGGSAAGYNVNQSTTANRPVLVNGATNYSKFNYNPTIKFDSAQKNRLFSTTGSPDLLGNNGTAIIVTSQEVPNGSTFTYYSGSTGRYQLKPNFRFQTGLSGTGYTFDWSAPTEYPITSASIIASFGCAGNAALRKNSVEATTPKNVAALYNPSIVTGLYLGANNTSEYTNSSVAEVILFDKKLTAADMDKIETYLSIKYGITRGGNSNTGAGYNYIASNGTTILWDKNANSGFNNDITAIGRDDNSGLVQKQSISVNNGEALTIALGSSSIPTENATNTNAFSSDASFLAWGNNGLANTFNKNANKPTGIAERLDRVWKTQTTNFSQQTTFGFETSQITGIGNMESLCLLFDDDGIDLSNAVVATSCSYAVNPTGSRIEFKGITIPAGKPYFTLARIISPTQLANNGPLCTGGNLSLTSENLGSSTVYSWTGPNGFTSSDQNPTIPSIGKAAAGTYTAVITAYGCTTTLTTTVAVISIPAVTLNSITMCANAPKNLTATPDIAGSYSYAWTVPSGTTNPGDVASFVPGKAGTYSVIITVGGGSCASQSASGTVSINPSPTVTLQNVVGCEGQSFQMRAYPDAAGDYTYKWTAPSIEGTIADVNSFMAHSAGTYSVVITDKSTGCSSNIASGTIILKPLPQVSLSVTEGCESTITATAGTNYSYKWETPEGVPDPGNVNSFTTTKGGSYKVIVTDTTTLCTNEATINVTVFPAPEVALDPVTICINDKTGEVIHPATLDTKLSGSEYQFKWYLDPDTNPISGAYAGTYTVTQAGDYTVEVINTTTGCRATDNTTVTKSNPAESATASSSVNDQGKQTITVTVAGNGTYLYSMDGGDFQTSDTFENVSPGKHTITIHDTAGCTDITIEYTVPAGTIPKGISPGSGTKNSSLDLTSLGVKRLEIFNRYGSEVYSLDNYTNQWYGQSNDNSELPDGTYFYQVHTADNRTITGWVYVIRKQ